MVYPAPSPVTFWTQANALIRKNLTFQVPYHKSILFIIIRKCIYEVQTLFRLAIRRVLVLNMRQYITRHNTDTTLNYIIFTNYGFHPCQYTFKEMECEDQHSANFVPGDHLRLAGPCSKYTRH
jgi:hypothetical protein